MEQCTKETDFVVLKYRVDIHERDINELKEIYTSINNLAISVELMAQQSTQIRTDVEKIRVDVEKMQHVPTETEHMKTDIEEIQADVKALKEAPIAAMQHYKRSFVTALIAIIVAAFFAGKFFN